MNTFTWSHLMHWLLSGIFQKILALFVFGEGGPGVPITFSSYALSFLMLLFKHEDTCLYCDGVCLTNLALGLGIPCAPTILVHALVKPGCCWWLENQIHLFPPKEATEWLYKENTPKKCYRCVCSEPDGSLIKTIKKAPPDLRREIISCSGVVCLSYAKETRSGFILKLLI